MRTGLLLSLTVVLNLADEILHAHRNPVRPRHRRVLDPVGRLRRTGTRG